jgi:redox-sensitive bicupin YhaK (pirin superfamily)
MGPELLGNGKYMDVDQHPHIGLSTLTYLFEGEIEHRDSTGSHQLISSGDLGFMTSGKGITHTERTPEKHRNKAEYRVHGYQIWIALPLDKEEIEPRFDFFSKQEIQNWKIASLRIKLLAGNAFGKSAQLQGYSPLFMLDIFAEKASPINLRGQLEGELAFVIARGSITSKGEKVEAGNMLISTSAEVDDVFLEEGTQILLIGGEKLPEEHFLLWNFVSHSKDRLQLAKDEWINNSFPKVPGDKTYVPFPGRRVE